MEILLDAMDRIAVVQMGLESHLESMLSKYN